MFSFLELKVSNYYKGSYFGKPISGMMFTLANEINKSNNKYLWLWIVGIAD